MDFVSLDGNNLKLSLPDVSTWVWWNWVLLGVICNAAYGFVTHLVTLPAIHRYQKEHAKGLNKAKELSDLQVFATLLLRLTIQGPFRVIMLTVGVAWWFLLFISTFKIRVVNEPLGMGWKWYFTPSELANELS